ncbi:MAG: hypothetical protein M0Z41_20695 [Peptococcaceae bacterium]|jgi:hypothetical protein|nr:hypothetical protein [Peptococcaceae bacterium]
MKPEAEEELAVLEKMVLAWKEDYAGEPEARSDFLFEIEETMYPYLRRLYECGYIDRDEFSRFMYFCDRQVAELSNL